ncbi:unnamed protein product [Heligmosomoides polygyrus]|uniref:Uncharacterized protein n=1 Tax=Heligmosomoides polygyrus TaxID=6339 RepID=A0A183FKB7_HELPZ|nr:unnamed protein product [Heligmosomoides polygyrus]
MRSLRAPCTTAIERSPRFIASERFAAPEVPVSASLLHCEGRGVARAEPPTRTVAQQFTALNSEVDVEIGSGKGDGYNFQDALGALPINSHHLNDAVVRWPTSFRRLLLSRLLIHLRQILIKEQEQDDDDLHRGPVFPLGLQSVPAQLQHSDSQNAAERPLAG